MLTRWIAAAALAALLGVAAWALRDLNRTLTRAVSLPQEDDDD